MTAARWKVAKASGQWTVTAPGGCVWTGAVSLAAAINLARSLADIETMITSASRPRLTVTRGGR